MLIKNIEEVKFFPIKKKKKGVSLKREKLKRKKIPKMDITKHQNKANERTILIVTGSQYT